MPAKLVIEVKQNKAPRGILDFSWREQRLRVEYNADKTLPNGEWSMVLPEFLRQEPDGEIHLTDHRIGLFHVVHYYNEGYSPEMLVCRYPTLPLALVHKVIAFYLESQVEVDAYIADSRARLQEQRDTNPRRLDAESLRQRLEAGQRTEVQNPAAKV